MKEIELYHDSLLVHAISANKNKSLKSDTNILMIFDILNVILNEILMSILVRDSISKETAHRFYGMNFYEKLIFSTKENRFIPSDAMLAAATLPYHSDRCFIWRNEMNKTKQMEPRKKVKKRGARMKNKIGKRQK